MGADPIPDPARSAALAWLTEVLLKRCPGCSLDPDAPSGLSHIRENNGAYLAEAILSAPGVEVDQYAVLDGATLNLAGKRVRVTLPLVPLKESDVEWLFADPRQP